MLSATRWRQVIYIMRKEERERRQLAWAMARAALWREAPEGTMTAALIQAEGATEDDLGRRMAAVEPMDEATWNRVIDEWTEEMIRSGKLFVTPDMVDEE